MERFWKKTAPAENGCIEWTGGASPEGYGVFCFDGRIYPAHRFVMLMERTRALQKDQCVCHTCDNRKCVNPDHLYVGSRASNARDMRLRKRAHRPVGTSNPSAKLTEADVYAIRGAKGTQQAIADRYGISQGMVGHIKRRVAWSHLP